MNGEDKRRDPRVDTNQAVWIEGQDARVEGEARNMSRSGMFVVTKASMPDVGGTLEIRFEDPREGAVTVTMEVVWRSDEAVRSKLGLRLADQRDIATFERVVERQLGVHPSSPRPSITISEPPPAPGDASAKGASAK